MTIEGRPATTRARPSLRTFSAKWVDTESDEHERVIVDLSYQRFDQDASVTALPPDLAVLLVGVTARQAASPTALFQARLFPRVFEMSPFFPASGAFDATVAARMAEWGQQ